MGKSRPLLCLFLYFSHYNFNHTNWRKHSWCAWYLNPGLQDGRRTQNNGIFILNYFDLLLRKWVVHIANFSTKHAQIVLRNYNFYWGNKTYLLTYLTYLPTCLPYPLTYLTYLLILPTYLPYIHPLPYLLNYLTYHTYLLTLPTSLTLPTYLPYLLTYLTYLLTLPTYLPYLHPLPYLLNYLTYFTYLLTLPT